MELYEEDAVSGLHFLVTFRIHGRRYQCYPHIFGKVEDVRFLSNVYKTYFYLNDMF